MVHTNSTTLAMINTVGDPRLSLPTFVSYPRSFSLYKGRSSLVFDTVTENLQEPCADEQERAMGFLTGTTSRRGVFSVKGATFFAKAWI